MGIYIRPRDSNVKVWTDSDFSGNWFREELKDDSDMAHSCSGFVVSYFGCPVMWMSQLQTEISLRSNESEYILPSQALHKTITIIVILKETKSLEYNIVTASPNVLCKMFEVNSGYLALALALAMRPRTKHTNMEYHHLRSYFAFSTISIITIESYKQPAYILMHPLNEDEFIRNIRSIMGW